MPGVNTSRGRLWIADHRRQRQRPAALFIHGAGGSHLSFPAALRQLPSISPILVDLPGHGRSPGAGRASIADYALDIVALLDALAIDSAIMLGHSMGGAVAQWLALEHAARVDALVLAGTGARLPVNPALIQGVIDDPGATISSIVRWMWARQAPDHLKRQTAEICWRRRRASSRPTSWPATVSMCRDAWRNRAPDLDPGWRERQDDAAFAKPGTGARHRRFRTGAHPESRSHDALGAAGPLRRAHRRLAASRRDRS